MTTWHLLRLIKWIGVIAFGAGALGATRTDLAERQRATYWLTTAGFVLSWVAGYGMLKLSGVSMGAPWVSASMVGSLVALNAAIWSAEAEGRRIGGYVAVAALAVTLALMIWRPL